MNVSEVTPALSGSVAYWCNLFTVGPLTMAYRLRAALAGDPIDYSLNLDTGGVSSLENQAPATSTTTSAEHLDRGDVIKTIRAALKSRSGKPWSVTGGRGTSWGWLRIVAPPTTGSTLLVPEANPLPFWASPTGTEMHA